MGCWGMGIAQSDEYCDVYDRFMDAYNEGAAIEDIVANILSSYHAEFSDDDGIMHDVYFALAKAEWMCCALSPAILEKVSAIISSGDNIRFLRELEATEKDLRLRQKNLEKFLESLKTPRSKPRRRTPEPKNLSAESSKGMVFWYKSGGAFYGAVVLEKLAKDCLLIALSQALPREPGSVSDVLEAEVYTAAWFMVMLPQNRVHVLGSVDISADYNGCCGLFKSEKLTYNENNGLDDHWRHTKRKLTFEGKKLADLLDIKNVPDSFDDRDILGKLLNSGRNLIYIR